MNLGKIAKGILQTVAPTLATAVGGPLGGVAVKFLADKFVGGDTGQVEDFLMAASPEKLAELKIADKDFQVEMRKLDIDLEKLNVQDRASARDLAKSKGIIPQVTLSVVYTVGYFAVMFFFITGKIQVPPDSKVMFGGLLGVLSTAQIQIMNFWFGSSAGSKAKTEAMANGRA